MRIDFHIDHSLPQVYEKKVLDYYFDMVTKYSLQLYYLTIREQCVDNILCKLTETTQHKTTITMQTKISYFGLLGFTCSSDHHYHTKTLTIKAKHIHILK